MEGEPFWTPLRDINEHDAETVLRLTLADDRALALQVERDLSAPLNLLDGYLTLFLRLLQIAYRAPEEWLAQDTIRAAIGMAVSTFNYLLLARLGTTHGYFAEVRSLTRDCHERMTRCWLFLRDAEVANLWLNGARIQQAEVDRRLSKSLETEDEAQKEVHRTLREKYERDSEAVHPNLTSLMLRLAAETPEDAKERVGKDVLIGGVMGTEYGRQTLLAVAASARVAVSIFRHLFADDLVNKVNEEYDELNARQDKITEGEDSLSH